MHVLYSNKRLRALPADRDGFRASHQSIMTDLSASPGFALTHFTAPGAVLQNC